MITLLPPIPPWLEQQVKDAVRVAVVPPQVCVAAWGRYVVKSWEAFPK